MKYVNEFRDANLVNNLKDEIARKVTQSWTIMEICGGQTHAIMKYSLIELLPKQLNLVHGPGCPVCVTPTHFIDKAVYLSSLSNVIIASFGDMMRVPGSKHDLLVAKANGANIQMVLSPLDAVKTAVENPDKEIVFFGVGFETTAPSIALAIKQAKKLELKNFSVLVALVLVPPAIEAILSNNKVNIQGFLAAGHVCSVMGYHQYHELAQKYKVPIVVTGFEPVDILLGVLKTVEMLETKKHEVENAYVRSVSEKGNIKAQEVLQEVFKPVDRQWRGIGIIPLSGLELANAFKEFDAEEVFNLSEIKAIESVDCLAGEILQGIKTPIDCPLFNNECKPEHPIGAPMVSSEGSCAAYVKYAKMEV